MNTIAYILIPLVVFTLLLYPLIRKIASLLEILVSKYTQQVNSQQGASKEGNTAATLQTVINLKLLAYERIVLLIERLKPDSLIPRTLSASLNCKEYQLLLLSEIRQEFEYNLSQQLYLSENAWKVTVSFKDNIITLINSAAAECQSNGNASQLAQKILEHYIITDLKADQILKIIKSDIQ